MTPHPHLSPGKELGQYELLVPIAQGGMATVWAARRKGLRGFQKTVAVKTMLPSLSDDTQFETMFLEEARLASGIHHPNVAEILDLGEQDDILYIVMEWVDGEALSAIARAANKSSIPFPLPIALRIVGQACLGLHAAHELRDPLNDDQLLGLVHRDVSPQNVLVTYDGHVKLVDFGVAKATNRASSDTSAGQLKGKVPYMSPEQARGGQVDRRTDIFAMGIVLYKLTTGSHPFAGENDLVTMRNIISRPALPPRVKKPDISAELEQVLLKCLQKDPDKRYQTMLELERAVQQLTAKDPPMTDDDVGVFVRTVMGDRNQRRRAALRDAVRTLDGRVSSPSMDEVPARDSLSDFSFNQLSSGAQRGSVPPPQPSAPSVTLDLHPSANAQGLRAQELLGPARGETARRGLSVVAMVSVAALATAAGVAVALFGGQYDDRSAATRPADAPTASARPPATEPSVSSAPALSQTASAPVLDVNELPEVTNPLNDSGAKAPLQPAAPTASADPANTVAPPGSAANERKVIPVRPSSTRWVPKVTNPGF